MENNMNIYERMACVRNEIGVVGKNLLISVSNSNSYKAVSERDVLEAVTPLLDKYRIYAYPVTREIDDMKQIVTTTKYGDKTSFYFHYKSVMRFVNIDKPEEYIDIVSYSTGIDTGDKADGKAMTYADKYAFMKAFNIITGEDAENEASQEYKPTINKQQWDDLRKICSKEQIMKIFNELGITKGTDITVEKYNEIKAEYEEKFKKEHPDKEFF